VLGRDAAAAPCTRRVGVVVEGVHAIEEDGQLEVRGAQQVEVQVAVADVTEAQRLDARQTRGDDGSPGGQELGDARDGSAMSPLCGVWRCSDSLMSSRSAHRPRAWAGLRRAARRDLAGLLRVAEALLEVVLRLRGRGRAGTGTSTSMSTYAGSPRRTAPRRRGGEHVAQAAVVEALEGRQREAAGAHAGEQREHGGVVVDGAQGHAGVGGRATQPQRDLDDHAERALGADEQLTQVVAGVVLDQRAAEVEARARGDHGAQAEHPVAREPVAQDLHAAGVGRQAAADVRRTLGRVVDRVEQAVLGGDLVDALQGHAGLAAQGAGRRVDREHAVHLLEREDHLTAGRRRGAGEARAPAGRDDRRAVRGAGADDGLHLLDGPREHDRRGVHRPSAAAPVAAVVGELGRVGGAAVLTDGVDEGAVEVGGGHYTIAAATAEPRISWRTMRTTDFTTG
jgi:hypothetical protein